jgi:glycosyltransferase involved in cell wall biosynthesis
MELVIVAEQLRRRVPGGIGTYTRGLLQGLREASPPNLRITLHASRPPASPDPLAGIGYPIVASRWPAPLLTRAWDRGWLAAPESDLVHATSLAFPPAGDRPLSVLVHDLAWREVPEAYPPRGRRWHEAALGRALRTARMLVAPSRYVADQLVAGGAPHQQVEVIEEGCDHLPAADIDGARALAESLGAREGFLLTVSTREPRKNLERLLEAYELSRTELAEPWPLLVVGPDGWGDTPDRRDAPHGVRFTGRVDDAVLAGLYRLCRCLVYVPLSEGFGLPPVEAMRECAPVVASPIPSTAGAALDVDPLDPKSIARAMVVASSDERARSELVTAGLVRTQELTWHRAADQHVQLWENLA